MGLGNALNFEIHPALKVTDFSFEEIFEKTEATITQAILKP
jgi:1-acyl-sn-glycerol-3-phosphate acyltransferase